MDDYLEEIVSAKFDELDYLESLDSELSPFHTTASPQDDDEDTELTALFRD